jgi:hypothetical protein
MSCFKVSSFFQSATVPLVIAILLLFGPIETWAGANNSRPNHDPGSNQRFFKL